MCLKGSYFDCGKLSRQPLDVHGKLHSTDLSHTKITQQRVYFQYHHHCTARELDIDCKPLLPLTTNCIMLVCTHTKYSLWKLARVHFQGINTEKKSSMIFLYTLKSVPELFLIMVSVQSSWAIRATAVVISWQTTSPFF